MSSQLVFSSASESFKSDRDVIRAGLRDTYNRLHSIAEDAEFVATRVRAGYPALPIVANQRAGAWYVKPEDQSTANHYAYFKSTDGHIGQPAFNLRRANLVLLPLINDKQGIVLVDSTRRGKRFPDALSKTIPIWCAVLNLARTRLLPPAPANSSVSAAAWADEGKLWTSPVAVGRSEHAQIEVNIARWADDLCQSSYDLAPLLALDRPLRPIFVSPASDLDGATASFERFVPVVCVSASKLAAEADGLERARGFTYVQGAGDDHESWCPKGLNPALFWAHAETILSAPRQDTDRVIQDILTASATDPVPTLENLNLSSPESAASSIRSTPLSIWYAAPPSAAAATDICITASRSPPPPSSDLHSPTHLYPRTGRQGYPLFFAELENAVKLVEDKLRKGDRVSVVVEAVAAGESQGEANDLGSALLVAVLVRCFDDDAKLRDPASGPVVATKQLIRSRLHWLLAEFPLINPPRAILNRLNEFLMSPPRALPTRY